jgi:hypothetical protein
MAQMTNRALAICFAIVASAWVGAASDAGSKTKAASPSTVAVVPGGVVASTTDLQPFTHTAYIPASADLSSIKFESVKAVKVATTRVVSADESYCDAGFSEPGGSLYCPSVRDGSSAPAFQVTYSFSAPPMSADEYGSTQFTFSVNMRPEELSPAVRQAISERKMSRREGAKVFEFATTRGSVPRLVIDDANSVFCQGRYTDGAWGRSQTNCRDKVTYKTVAVPSDYVTVTVNPASVQ